MKKLIFLFCLISTALISQPVLTGRQGGTGVANTNKTITLGASITTTGTASPTLAFPSTSRTFTFPDSADRVALLHWTLPRTGTISGYPLTNRIEFKTGTTALSSTLTPYYIGYGNNLDLSSATAFAHAKFGTDGFGNYQNLFSIKGASTEAYITMGELVGINMYSNLIASPTSYANVDISGSNFTAGHYASNGNSYITFQPSGVANVTSTYTLFPGLKYDATTAGYVTTNQTQYSLLHRAANDARYGLQSGTLAQFAATSSAQLAGVISDETGSGSLVFATSPTLTTAELGSSTATTQAFGDNSTKVATTAHVTAAMPQVLNITGNATTTSTVAATISGSSSGSFTFSIAANGVYWIDAMFAHSCSGAGGVKYQFDVPGTSTLDISLNGGSTSNSTTLFSRLTADATLSSAYCTVNGGLNIRMTGFIYADGTGGVVSIGFASGTSGQTSTVIAAGSGMTIHRKN